MSACRRVQASSVRPRGLKLPVSLAMPRVATVHVPAWRFRPAGRAVTATRAPAAVAPGPVRDHAALQGDADGPASASGTKDAAATPGDAHACTGCRYRRTGPDR